MLPVLPGDLPERVSARKLEILYGLQKSVAATIGSDENLIDYDIMQDDNRMDLSSFNALHIKSGLQPIQVYLTGSMRTIGSSN